MWKGDYNQPDLLETFAWNTLNLTTLKIWAATMIIKAS